jgi:hypothetical protein
MSRGPGEKDRQKNQRIQRADANRAEEAAPSTSNVGSATSSEARPLTRTQKWPVLLREGQDDMMEVDNLVRYYLHDNVELSPF